MNIEEINKRIDCFGLILAGLLSLAYALFYVTVAKVYINLSFVEAPFFIGDMVFVASFILFLIKWSINKKRLSYLVYLFIFYIGFVLMKLIIGYLNWGPLALRHAVLFFYPVFAVFSFSFYREDFFRPHKSAVFALFIICMFKFFGFHPYFIFTCMILCVVLINSLLPGFKKYLLYALLLLALPYKFLFNTSRTFITSNLIALLFIGLGSLTILKIKLFHKYLIFGIFTFLIFMGVLKFSNPHEIISLVGFKELSRRYHNKIDLIETRRHLFKDRNLSVKLYNQDGNSFNLALLKKKGRCSDGYASNSSLNQNKGASFVKKTEAAIPPGTAVHNPDRMADLFPRPELGESQIVVIQEQKKQDVANCVNDNSRVSKNIPLSPSVSLDKNRVNAMPHPRLSNSYLEKISSDSDRGIDVPYANSLFRIFIWKDLVKEFISNCPIFGFDFGKPFRSRSLEILDWAVTEWGRDGWICIHNSYLDIIYRAGIIGILMVISIISSICWLAIESLKTGSLSGVLLTGGLINWFTAANFLEILEMPYTAIPLWILYGLTFAYLFKGRIK